MEINWWQRADLEECWQRSCCWCCCGRCCSVAGICRVLDWTSGEFVFMTFAACAIHRVAVSLWTISCLVADKVSFIRYHSKVVNPSSRSNIIYWIISHYLFATWRYPRGRQRDNCAESIQVLQVYIRNRSSAQINGCNNCTTEPFALAAGQYVNIQIVVGERGTRALQKKHCEWHAPFMTYIWWKESATLRAVSGGRLASIPSAENAASKQTNTASSAVSDYAGRQSSVRTVFRKCLHFTLRARSRVH